MLVKMAGTMASHAEHELDLIGMTADNKDEMNRLMRKQILDILKMFGKQGHSGFSAGYAINLLEKLLRHKPLSPLKGTRDEWTNITNYYSKNHDKRVYQNKRYSSVFKEVDKKTGKEKAYDISGIVFKDKSGATYTSGKSRVPVTFPYTPKQVIKKG